MIYPFQRSFLLRPFDFSALQTQEAVQIITFYTKISSKESLKFQNVGEKYFLYKNHLKEELSKKDFDKAMEKALLKRICKKSYEFLYKEKKAFLQVYKGDKLLVLKVFFESKDEATCFKIGDEMPILKELDEKFNSKNLILYDYKKVFFDIQTCFNIIEKNQNFTLNFPQALYANDGFRVLLFYLLCSFKTMLKNKEQMQDLHFCILKICVFLENSIELFDAKTAQKLLKHFKKFEKNLKENLTKKHCNIKHYRALLNDFELFLREGEFFKNVKNDTFLKRFIAHKLCLKLDEFQKYFCEHFSYEDFIFQCLELRIFISHFAHFFNDKNLEKLKTLFDDDIFVKFVKKRGKILKLMEKASKNLKIYKG